MKSTSDIPVITIDGPSGSGKGTVARRLANSLGFHLLDSGALYRVVALLFGKNGIEGIENNNIVKIIKNMDVRFEIDKDLKQLIFLNDKDVTDDIRTESCGKLASSIAGLSIIRTSLLERQYAFKRLPGLVADGRDMGSHVFPDAKVKIFLTATIEERAKRRFNQLKGQGIDVSLAALLIDINERDDRDKNRSVAPLMQASDAKMVDSSNLSIDKVTDLILGLVSESGLN